MKRLQTTILGLALLAAGFAIGIFVGRHTRAQQASNPVGANQRAITARTLADVAGVYEISASTMDKRSIVRKLDLRSDGSYTMTTDITGMPFPKKVRGEWVIDEQGRAVLLSPTRSILQVEGIDLVHGDDRYVRLR